jgi:hypothetical protein
MRPTPSTLKLPAKLVDELGGYGEIEIESIDALTNHIFRYSTRKTKAASRCDF